MPSITDNVGKGSMFSGYPIRSFIGPDRSHYPVLEYLMNSLSSVRPVRYCYHHRFWRLKVKVAAGRRCGEGIQVDAEACSSYLSHSYSIQHGTDYKISSPLSVCPSARTINYLAHIS